MFRMMLLKQILDDAKTSNTNFFEFYLHNNNIDSSDNIDVYDTSISKEIFYRVMQNIQSKYKKSQVQHCKVSVLGDTIYCNFENKEITVVSKRVISTHHVCNNILCIGINKKKLSILSFPSTQNFDNEEFNKILTFKISNRISLLFTQSKDVETKHKSYEIKLAYTHDDNVEQDAIIKVILNILQVIQASIC
jgi:hypothetical protein